MTLPILHGTIARRILVNFRADLEVVQRLLPEPFRPKLHDGYAIVGVCLIRLENIRPAPCSSPIGFSSENAAHRIAVLWDEAGETREGVYIPRRDTGSWLNHLTGGRLFPGEHQLASFDVQADEKQIRFQMQSKDEQIKVRVVGDIFDTLPIGSCFASLMDASRFFEGGCIGFSTRCDGGLDGLRLATKSWSVQTLAVSEVYSSYFSDTRSFPQDSIQFDHALLMRNIPHEWHPVTSPV